VEDDEGLFPEVPKAPKVPEPPQVNYTRPTLPDDKPISDAVKNRMARRGLSVGNTPTESQSMGRATTIGTNFIGCVIAGAGLGWLVDKYILRNPAMPWGLITGVLLGLFAGVTSMIRLSNAINEADEKAQKAQQAQKNNNGK
jgi:F0F1-type ATP synthase assembly protein I